MTVLFRHSTAFACVAAVILALAVAGCGKKGAPERPMGSEFPRQYPNPNPPANPGPQQ